MSRKSFTAEFKAKVALEAIRGERTINKIASEHGVHPNQVSDRKREAMAGVKETFSVNRSGAKFRFRLKFEERVHLKLDGNLS